MSSGAESARVFFALDPGFRVRQQLVTIQEELRIPGRPVPPDNLHITLVFVGQVPASRINALRRIAGQVAMPACELVLDRRGWFPRAAVAWLGSAQPPPRLLAFQSELAGQIRAGGFAADARPWVPHLTLYRKLRKPGCIMAIDAVRWPLNGFCLMRSVGTRSGVHYEALDEWAAAN